MRKILFFSVCTLLLTTVIFAGCSTSSNVDSSELSDSSYVGVNYTDTGRSGISRNNSSEEVDLTKAVRNFSSAVSEINSSAEKTSSVISNDKVYSSSSVLPESTTKTTITYYYDDENTDQPSESSQSDSADTDSDNNITDTEPSYENESDSEELFETESDVFISDGEFTVEDLMITVDGYVFTFDQNIDDVLSVLEEPLSVIDTTNESAPELIKKMYSFDRFCIEAALSDDGESFTTIGMQIFDDSVKTDKGVYIGMTAKEAVEIYGSDMMIYGDYYRYYIGSKYMYLYISNGIVANIGYSIDRDLESEEKVE